MFFFFEIPFGRSHRLPDISFRPLSKVLIVKWQPFPHSLQSAILEVWVKCLSCSGVINPVSVQPVCCAYNAAPNAPIMPATAGLTTSLPTSNSNARNTASFRKVPPCTTICLPKLSPFAARITLYITFFTTLYDKPAEISVISAPSRCACLIEEFINTVHREPRFTGCFAANPSLANSEEVYPIVLA